MSRPEIDRQCIYFLQFLAYCSYDLRFVIINNDYFLSGLNVKRPVCLLSWPVPCFSAIGKVNQKVVPFSSSLSTQISPPCPFTAKRQNASPTPKPPGLFLPRKRVNFSKMRSCSDIGIPGPESLTQNFTNLPSVVVWAPTSLLPLTGVNLIAFSSKFTKTR